ncbi:MAG: tetratricopeptide repeat-containing sulfotransferase family protein [Yoonia sp.]|uniref:tetratricopeptide repeat-containing sulfotransferase family protein n=1 Tax=Yoonia sp. TaxID=2212373 RepID=UPI003EF50672
MENPITSRRKLPPTEILAVLKRGLMAQQAGEFQRAEFQYQTVLRDHPKHPDALNMMGTIALEAKKPAIASGYFRKAVKQMPRNAIFLFNLGCSQLVERKPQLAIETLRKVTLMQPSHVKTWATLGKAEAALGKHDAALDAYDHAAALNPDDLRLAVERAEVLVNLGRMEDAADVFRTAIAADVETARAMIGLSMAHKFRPEDPEPAQMLALLQQDDLDPSRRRALRYAAGKALADQKDFDAAFVQFATAKDETKESFAIDLHREAFQQRKELFTADFLAARSSLGNPTKRPIFVVGMPRSGTTLTEQILASHPQIAGAAELSNMRQIAGELGLGNVDRSLFARNLEKLTEGQARKLASRYLAVLKRHSATAQRVVDKMPHNYELLGLIAILFPNAQIIHCQRDAMDTCVSCFTQHFSEAHGYNGDLRMLGQYYRAYHDLMSHWDRALPGRILHSRYEDLIKDQESASRRLIAWTGLEWDEACLSFQKTERLVTTPSRWQVRQPIYKTSVKKWENYAPHLGPLKKALGSLADV